MITEFTMMVMEAMAHYQHLNVLNIISVIVCVVMYYQVLKHWLAVTFKQVEYKLTTCQHTQITYRYKIAKP